MQSIMHDLPSRSDREIAIVGGSLVDNALELAIRRNRIVLSKSEEESLITDGPLETFSNKIKIAKMLGILHPTLANDLDCLRKIRNAFAHASKPIDFSNNSVEGFCLRFKSIETYCDIHDKYAALYKDKMLPVFQFAMLGNFALIVGNEVVANVRLIFDDGIPKGKRAFLNFASTAWFILISEATQPKEVPLSKRRAWLEKIALAPPPKTRSGHRSATLRHLRVTLRR